MIKDSSILVFTQPFIFVPVEAWWIQGWLCGRGEGLLHLQMAMQQVYGVLPSGWWSELWRR